MKNIIATILLLLFTVFLSAQNAANDFKKMNKFYLEHNHVKIDIEYRFYKNHKSNNAIDVQKASYKKSGTKFYYTMGGITTIQNNEYKMVLNKNNEIILVAKKQKEIDPAIFTGTTIDSVLTMCKRVDFVITESGNKRYMLLYKSSKYYPYSKVIVELNSNNSLSKMIYYYNNPINYTPDQDDIEEAPKMEIVYLNTSIEPISTSQYSINKFVKIQGQNISPASKYIGYRIINQII